MKKIYTTLVAVLAITQFSFAQWTTTGSDIYNSNAGNVGIGTTSPSAKLDVNGESYFAGNIHQVSTGGLYWGVVGTYLLGISGNTTTGKMSFSTNSTVNMTIDGNGKVGIGTTNPSSLLQVNGEAAIRTNTSTDGYIAINPGGSTSQGYISWWKPGPTRVGYMGYTDGSGTNNLALNLESSANFIVNGGNLGIGTASPESGYKLDVNGLGTIGTQGSARIYMGTIDATHALIQSRDNSINQKLEFDASSYNFNIGNVGIGTTDTKGYQLAVNGSAIATSMTVKPYANWPDYVFKPAYTLPTLLEVKNYINKNHHLPNMPSEQEVKENGLDLGEINTQLTKKVEELTLYLIEQNKQLTHQQHSIKSLQKQINSLKKQTN